MNYFTQRFPSFVTGFTPFECEFGTIDELIEKWRPPLEAHHYELAPKTKYMRNHLLMMVSNDDSNWWVVGYIRDEIVGLSIFKDRS